MFGFLCGFVVGTLYVSKFSIIEVGSSGAVHDAWCALRTMLFHIDVYLALGWVDVLDVLVLSTTYWLF